MEAASCALFALHPDLSAMAVPDRRDCCPDAWVISSLQHLAPFRFPNVVEVQEML